MDETAPEVVRSVLLERGWDKYDEKQRDVGDWDLYWRTSSFRMTEHTRVHPWQRLNHHPGTARITRKDHLAKHLERMRKMCSTPLYEFIPLTFVMPSDYTKFIAEYFKETQALGTKRSYWISKPAELSRGRGIVIFSDIKDLFFNNTYILQKYICNPLLVGRYKCDLRIYVCVTGFHPLTVYVYQEGLVRFATEKFDLSNLQDYYAHLTNSSINKSGASYEKVKEVVGQGCKWTLSRFLAYLRNWDVDDLILWQKINCLVILTVLAMVPSVPFATNCFELFGFDILIDDTLKPWLLEVNYSPDLSLDCSADVVVKRELVHDLIELIYFNGLNEEGRECGKKAANRNPAASPAQGDACQLGRAPRPLPSRSLSQFTRRAHSQSDSAVEKAIQMSPKPTRTSRLRERLTLQKDSLLPSGEAARAKPRLKGRTTPCKAPSPWVSCFQPQPCKTKGFPGGLWDPERAPGSRAGNFVLIFPFNEATFRASRNGLNVKRIIQELQKLTNKQHPQVAKNETKR